jgi:hypothetical protein
MVIRLGEIAESTSSFTLHCRNHHLDEAFWYVSNVSIIFDAPCLFLHHLLSFHYTLWHFYAFSGTNLLTRCHSVSSLFSAIFVFQKSYTRNILGIGWNKSQTSRNSPKLPENRRGDGVGPRGAHTIGRRGPGVGRPPMCVAASVHFWRCPFAYKDPPMGKT